MLLRVLKCHRQQPPCLHYRFPNQLRQLINTLPHNTIVADFLHLGNLPLEVFQVAWLIAVLATANHDPWRLLKQSVHLLKWSASSFRQNGPEEDGVGQVAYHEQVVVLPPYVFHRDGSDLTLSRRLAALSSGMTGATHNQSIEGK